MLSRVQICNSQMEVEGILLNLSPGFGLFKNLKAQILEICPSAHEYAKFYHTMF